ncbi:hypothetical protein Poli38472_009386 [Pythium oligandrum]|uniref:Uncharacterized protein n=1 Tax=Pythium oligandrum TaxID=41045 RepID=A0A8K1FLG0_PYTOL|nr:hypothetical protein Poli38472_009386 [Pythium oligandrum]|eukprot:TMW65219.1 hypothetical protein Poli38472_009386 [Pythium oligandrum]
MHEAVFIKAFDNSRQAPRTTRSEPWNNPIRRTQDPPWVVWILRRPAGPLSHTTTSTITHFKEVHARTTNRPTAGAVCSHARARIVCLKSWFGNCVDHVTHDTGGLSTDFHLAQQQGLVMPPAAPDIADIKQPTFGILETSVSSPTVDIVLDRTGASASGHARRRHACMVNEVGMCVDKATGSYNPAMDFRIAQELNLVFPAAADTNASTGQRWHFPDATYCDTSDVVCKHCRDASADPSEQRFYHFVFGVKGGMTSLSGSSSGETASYVVTKTLAPQDYKPGEGQCTHYTLVEKDGCVKPRTCGDCLLKEGCMINQFGVCVDQLIDGYNKDMDFRVAQKLNLTFPSAAEKNATTEQRWHFPAFGAEYCDTSDAVCKQCRQAKYWFHDGIGADSRYCVGDGGCICISVCDSTTWEASMPALCPFMSEFPEVNSGLSVAAVSSTATGAPSHASARIAYSKRGA